jgi:ABC-2 type transport system permease protein
LPPIHLIVVKYAESLFFASWSLILLGLPLMLAIAQMQEEAWGFYPLFVAFFLSFVPIPAALGLIAAWAVARYSPRSGPRTLLAAAGVLLAFGALWAVRFLRANQLEDAGWVKDFFSHMDFVETAILPSTWVSRGIEHALRGDHLTAMGYLAVTLSNGLFTSLLAVAICARRFGSTFDRAVSTSGRRPGLRGGWKRLWDGLGEVLFWYMPVRLRLIAAKDLRTFLRDPLQWSQLVILFGLMALYLMNLPQFAIDLAEHEWGWLVPFLNLCAITLILATFTSRFVFPLVSLEGHQLWLIGMLPLSRRGMLAAKFAYALTITSFVSVTSSILAAVSLEMGWAWGALNIVITLSICIGLCGLAVGLGARFPMFSQTNAGRIANGVGGTINLIISVSLVVLVLAGMAIVTHRARSHGYAVLPDVFTMSLVVAVMTLTLGTGWAAMRIGGRHLERLEV